MDTYNPSLAPRFSQLLAQREAELRAMLRVAGNLGGQEEDATLNEVVDFKDVATEQALSTISEAKAEYAAHELEQVLAALSRLKDINHGNALDFGRCLDCGEAIDLRRLTALPATPYCTACQTIHEQARPQALRF
ncbi:transcriptional regulator, TraR/DksA family [Polaromonas sp. OV174]|uniref:TraR/DksA family transcriptional regulator n=1 Tax=Polaromonas sp. OV174 TaxID=1855300 RepID=UPI0008E4F6A5|nr:TraR/DksA C4-type zinc finger protein [Polaromonas sp. OV174]SFC25651.1 transcriptional regulator, TraR/DksA family [Polaromonas sp. OV174]